MGVAGHSYGGYTALYHAAVDARCMFAKGKSMACECACGGKNHGKGSFVCEAA